MSDDHDWTSSIIDRLNEFARENSDEFNEIKTGHEAADMIVRMHGRYNELRLAERVRERYGNGRGG